MYKKIFAVIKKILDAIGKIVSTIINFILLNIVYFLSIGLTSIIAKLFGKHFLDLKSEKDSNWVEHELTKEPIKNYYRTF